MSKRILRFTVTVRADVTAGPNETQEEADAETARMVLPSIERGLPRQLGATVCFDSSTPNVTEQVTT